MITKMINSCFVHQNLCSQLVLNGPPPTVVLILSYKTKQKDERSTNLSQNENLYLIKLSRKLTA